nr:ribonuclease H-like domain-containing protein [Tanacetum cinerariifolium]
MARDGSVFRYDPDYLREQFAGLVIQRALPFNHFDHEQTIRVFQNTMLPTYTHVSRSTLKRDAMKLWLAAKQEIIDSFGNINAFVNLTTDVWSTPHGVPSSYMCVTAHWIEPGLRFVSCDLALRFCSAFCLIEDLIAFSLREALPNSKPRCVLSQIFIAFCLNCRPIGKMIVDSIENGPYVRRMISTPGEPDLPVPVPESLHEQTNEELTETDIKRMDADDQAIQTILLGLPEDVYAAEKKAKLFNEWEKFTSTDDESIESYYHYFMQLMNDLKRNKHFPENIALNLKFLNNLQPEWKRHVTIVRQTKNLHETDFTQIYDFLKMIQEETQLLIAQKEEAGIQLQAEEFDFMAAAGDLDEIEEVNANCILMANLQQVSKSSTQHDRAPVYDADGSAEVHLNDNCYDNKIFNMFTQEEQYTDLLEPIPELQLVPQNDNHVTSVAPSMVHSEGIVETSSAPNEEIHAHQETVYRNLVDQVAQRMALGYPNPLYLKKAQLKQQSLYNGNLLLKDHDPPFVYDSEETLELAQESREKMRLLKKEIKLANYAKINHLSGVFVPQTTKSKEELFLSNVSNMVTASKTISIPNEDLSDDTTPSVAQKFLNEVHIIISHEIAPIINQVDARVQNFEIQFLQEAAKFVRDFKSLAKEADESLDKQKSLELENERLLKESVSHDIMSIVQNSFVDVPSDLRTELDRTKEKLELYIIKKEKEYAVLSNNCHLKTTYKNLFDSIKSNRAHAKLHDLIFENAKLRAQLFKNTSKSVKNTSGTSVTPHVDKRKLSAVTPLSKKLHVSMPSHSVPQPREFNVMKHRNVIAPGMFKINPSQTPRANVSFNTVTASSTGLVHTAKTKRPQPKGNTRNARVNFASKSSEVKKSVNVEDHRRTLLLSKNQKTMSSECNNINLAIRNDKSKIVCDTCKQCLVTANHDACLTPSVNVLNSRANKLCANVPLSANQKKHRTQVVQICLWCVESGYSKHMTGNIKLLINFMWKFLVTVRFRNDHIAAILGVYFVEGLGHNLFSVGQFCDADLEVAFRRNTCFIRDLDDDYSRYTWVHFLRIKDETPEVIKNFLKKIYVRLQAPVIIVHTDNETEFKNHILKEYFDSVGITHETSTAKTPQQNGVVERKNRTLVEAARTMQKTGHLLPSCFGALCYPKNDREDIGKLGAKGDIGFFIGHSVNSVAYIVYNRRTRKIIETMNVTFNELSAMAFEQNSSRPGLQSMTPGQISSELELTYAPSIITPQRPSERDLDILFEPLHNEFLGGRPAEAPRVTPAAPVVQNLQAPTASMSFQDSAPVPTNSSNTLVSSHNVDVTSQQHAHEQRNLTPSPIASAADNVSNAGFEGELFVNPFGTPSTESVVSST